MRILLLEDDFTLSSEVKKFFELKSIECDGVYDGSLFMKQFNSKEYDLVVLDINVPGINGLQVCEKIREKNKKIPILMLTAFGDIEDKLEAFKTGADDYLVKPFHFEELFARVNSLFRRKENDIRDLEIIRIADLEISVNEAKVTRAGTEIKLTPKEFKLLSILAKAKGNFLSKQDIATKLWDYHIETNQNTIEVYVNFLRKKIDKDFDTKLIHTKVGYGYYLKEEV